MAQNILAVSDDGTIEYRPLTNKYLDGALKVMSDSFFRHENVHRAINASSEPGAIQELLQLCRDAAEDGVTVIAVDKSNDKVVGALFNKLQVNSDVEGESYYEKFIQNCKSDRSKFIVEYMMKVDSMCNLFELTKSDCIIELMFLGTLPECRGKGVGRKLCELSLDIAKKLKGGINVKTGLNGESLPIQPIPTAASAIFTSNISQKIAQKLNFTIAARGNYEDYSYKGVKFTDVIGNETQGFTLEYKLIE